MALSKHKLLRTRRSHLGDCLRACLFVMLGLAGVQSAPALAQDVNYSEDFVSGTAYNLGNSQVDNWEAFRDALTGNYSSITVGGTEGADVTCADPVAIAQIATALNTDAVASIACQGSTWNTGTCVGTNELSIDVEICTCQGASPFTLRPDVDAGNAAWGGIGATCGPSFSGAGTNANQTLTVFAAELGAPTDIDLSLSLNPASTSPNTGANTFIDVDLSNIGPADATGVNVGFALPSGFTFISDDSGGSYNPASGVWAVGAVNAGTSPRLRVIARVEASGNFALLAEVASANQNDTDSTPSNAGTVPGEDDGDAITLTPVSLPPPLFCLGRPIQPLAFLNPVAETPGANINSPQVDDVFRFPNVSPGIDALVQVTSFNNGASLVTIDNDGQGVLENFQPTLLAPGTGDMSVDFEITMVSTGTSIPGTLDFAGSAIDVDGNSVTLREYVEVSDNIVEFALNGQPVASDPGGPPTRIISQATTPPGVSASASSAANRVRFEAETSEVAAGIDPDEPRNIVAAFFTDVSVFQYRIGKFGEATAATGRLNSLAFNCPEIIPTTTQQAALEDFGDAPISYGNPIHVIDTSVLLGAANTDEFAPGDSANASSDTGDDGVTLPANFQPLQSVAITVDVTGAGGLLQGFIDWNVDGDFEDAGENIATDIADDNDDGTITLNITPPASMGRGVSFARFRWSTASVGNQDPSGDGEVEDYQVSFLGPVLSITKTASQTSIAENATVTFTIDVAELAGIDTANIVITDVVPAGLSIVSIANGGLESGNTVTWDIAGPLNASATASASVSFVARAGPVNADINITNTASALSDEVSMPVTDDTSTTVTDGPTLASACNILTDAAHTFAIAPESGRITQNTLGADFDSLITSAGFAPVQGTVGAAGVEYTFPTAGNAQPDQFSVVYTITPDPGSAVDQVVVCQSVYQNTTGNNEPNELTVTWPGGGGGIIIDPINQITSHTEGDVIASGTVVTFSDSVDNGDNGPTPFGGGLGGGDEWGILIDANAATSPFPVSVNSVGCTTTSSGACAGTITGSNVTGERFQEWISLNSSLTMVAGQAVLEAEKTVVVFDPLGEGLFAIPGNDVIYTITVRNVGNGPADDDTLLLIDKLPAEVIFFNGDADGPGPGTDSVILTETVGPVGLDPFDAANDVSFSNATTPPAEISECTYTPISGFDPAVTFVCFNPKGVFEYGDPDTEFTLMFRARIR